MTNTLEVDLVNISFVIVYSDKYTPETKTYTDKYQVQETEYVEKYLTR